MAKKTHLMFDLETLGVRPDAAIVEIGACLFDPHGEGPLRTFSVCLDVTRQGGSVDSGTVDFWLQQSEAARLHLVKASKLPTLEALDAFEAFLQPTGAITGVWSHGPAFDVTILQSLYNRVCRPVPWNYRHIRDTRTIMEAVKLLGLPEPQYPKDGTAHSGIDDAVNQAVWVQRAYKAICTAGATLPGADPLA